MAVSLSGMASGLDTDSVIQQLMAIEQNKVTAVQRRQVAVTQHKTDLSAVKTKLDMVKTAAADLSSATLWKPVQTTTSSDPTKVGVAVLSGAGIGGHTIQVNKLASSAQHGFTYDRVATDGKLTLAYTDDASSAVDIAVKANASATDIATAINANEKAPVYAAVVKEGTAERLVFSSRKTGLSSDFTVDTSQLADPSKMTEIQSLRRDTAAQLNADVVVDNIALVPPPESNVIENAIPGVRLTLNGVSTSPVSVTTTQPAVDLEAITKKITALVDAYNSVVTSTRGELAEKKVANAATTSDLQKGQLFGDSGLVSMLNRLKSVMTKPLDDLPNLKGLAEIGIGVPKAGASLEDAKSGKLVIDADKLKTALAADYTKVKELFAGSGATKGFSSVISDFVGSQTGTNGVLKARMDSDDKTFSGFTDQITKLNERMDAEQKRLKAQFAAMETALNNSQSQQAWLTSQIASLPSL
jgi:flagellar hook-associated protein 2